LITHFTFSSDGRHPLFPTLARRRAAVRCILRVAPECILFCVVDDHLHVVVVADPARTGRIAAALLQALRSISAAPLLPARAVPVETRRHLEFLADHYILEQSKKHGLADPPPLFEGSCFLDLVGARVVDPAISLRLVAAMPRYRMRRAYRAVGLEEKPIAPLPDQAIRLLGAARIVAASACAVAAQPGSRGNGPVERIARCAAVQLATTVGIAIDEVAFALGITRSSAVRLSHKAVPDHVLAAVRRRLALEALVASRPR
jgi:hypothetical protein